jgi:hypothetical protein
MPYLFTKYIPRMPPANTMFVFSINNSRLLVFVSLYEFIFFGWPRDKNCSKIYPWERNSKRSFFVNTAGGIELFNLVYLYPSLFKDSQTFSRNNKFFWFAIFIFVINGDFFISAFWLHLDNRINQDIIFVIIYLLYKETVIV